MKAALLLKHHLDQKYTNDDYDDCDGEDDEQTSVEDLHQVEGKVQKIISLPFGQCQVFSNEITSPFF